ncbi:BLUF domain-containing protein [Azospirillum sp. TSA6c]|uniref:BLUF domain-containing protein n=1 Tax=unclassified Azospirillum TaxID=2630922 RepID=UPI0018EE4F08|nr:BLUF domain-containing protein [Azospirillum sp. TSA6c]
MLTIVYRSEAIDRLPYSALADICLFSARKNSEQGITGFLVEFGGIFLQVLEGEAEAVDQLFARIVDDPRHRDVTPLLRETAGGAPEFGFWAMNFGPLDTPTFWQAIFGTPMRSEEFRQRSHGVGFARDVLSRAYMHACIVADVDPAARDMVRGNIPVLVRS